MSPQTVLENVHAQYSDPLRDLLKKPLKLSEHSTFRQYKPEPLDEPFPQLVDGYVKGVYFSSGWAWEHAIRDNQPPTLEEMEEKFMEACKRRRMAPEIWSCGIGPFYRGYCLMCGLKKQR